MLATQTKLLALTPLALGCSRERTDPAEWMRALERGEALACEGGSSARVAGDTLWLATEFSSVSTAVLLVSLLVASLSLLVFGVILLRAAMQGRDPPTPLGRAAIGALGLVALAGTLWLPHNAWSRGLGSTRVQVDGAGQVVAQVGRPGRSVRGPGRAVGLVYSQSKGGRTYALRVHVGDEDVTALRCREESEEALVALRDWLAARYRWRTEDTRWVFMAL